MVKRTDDKPLLDDTSDTDDVQDSRLNRRDRDDDYEDRRGRYNSREFSNRDWEDANAPTDPARRRAFREKWAQTHLPNLPIREGWHRCWVSTNNPTDTPARRIALGYRIITLDELKAQGVVWSPEAKSVKDGGDLDGAVRWREMIGMECTEDDYQDYMREFHHDLPRDMARDIFDPLNETAERVQQGGGRVAFGEGFHKMQTFARPPRQFE